MRQWDHRFTPMGDAEIRPELGKEMAMVEATKIFVESTSLRGWEPVTAKVARAIDRNDRDGEGLGDGGNRHGRGEIKVVGGTATSV